MKEFLVSGFGFIPYDFVMSRSRTEFIKARHDAESTVGELLMFKLLVSRSTTSLHLHSEEEGFWLFTVPRSQFPVPQLRRDGEFHITIL